jgi:hypothetical protein
LIIPVIFAAPRKRRIASLQARAHFVYDRPTCE